MIYYDTETIGLHGLPILIQWAEDDGEVNLHHIWSTPIQDTLDLIEYMMTQSVCGFNLAFDHFHLCKIYTTLRLLSPSKQPENLIDEIVEAEAIAWSGPCLKPVSACDLMLHARKGEYQSTMNRKSIWIRKIPVQMAFLLSKNLEDNLYFDPIYFARRKVEGPHWQVQFRKNKEGETIDPEFRDIVCNFKPSSALKVLARHALNYDDPILFSDVEPDAYPLELGYAPYAKAVMSLDKWVTKKGSSQFKGPYKGSWPAYLHSHKIHWTLSRPKKYAKYDVILTRDLHRHFGCPEPGDDDSELACMVGAVRWKGYDLNLDKIKELHDEAAAKVNRSILAPSKATPYIKEVMTPLEKTMYEKLGGGSSKEVLEELQKWEDHPVAERATEVINSRKQDKKRELYNKLLIARRFFAAFNVIGAKSSRMSGTGSLNAHGIDHTKEVRACFPLGDNLWGGDFSAFEVCIFDAVCDDPKLRDVLESGRKIHAIFGEGL